MRHVFPWLAALAVTTGCGDGGAGFVDLGPEVGITSPTRSWDAAVADVDGDGSQDVYVSHHWGQVVADALYRNVGGRFERQLDFSWRDRHDCEWADVDGDERLDLYCATGAQRGEGAGPNELHLQQADGSFEERGGAFGVQDRLGRGRRVAFLDADGDDDPDLYVTNERRPDGQESINRLFLNDRGRRFVEAPDHGLNGDLGFSCVLPGDVDSDGWTDLLLCDEVNERVTLFRNDEGQRFVDVTADTVGAAEGWRGAALADIDGDDRIDLVLVGRTEAQVRLQDASGRLATVTVSHALQDGGRTAAVADVNGDDRNDVYVVQGGYPCREADRASEGQETVNRPDVLLLGPDFVPADIPQVTRGCGDVVAPIDVDGDGTDELLVLNGLSETAGPVQVIAFRP